MPFSAEQIAAGIVIAHTCFTQGRYGDARTLIEGLITVQPENPYFHSLLGSVLIQQNALEEAISSLSKAIECYPENISAWTNRGETYLKLGRMNETAADLKRASELDPTGKDPFAARARLLLQVTGSFLKLASEKGPAAVDQKRQEILSQLKKN